MRNVTSIIIDVLEDYGVPDVCYISSTSYMLLLSELFDNNRTVEDVFRFPITVVADNSEDLSDGNIVFEFNEGEKEDAS